MTSGPIDPECTGNSYVFPLGRDNLAILFANCLKTDPTKRRFLKNVIEVEL